MWYKRLAQLSLALSSVVLVSHPTFAQRSGTPLRGGTEPIQITGTLRFADSTQPASDILVRLESLSGGSVGDIRTDRLGKFRFTGLNPEQYHVIVRHPGYREIQREVNLVMVSAENLQLTLVPEDPSRPAAASASKVIDASVPAAARHEYEKADAAFANGKRAEAIRHLEKALELYPAFVQGYLRLGLAYVDAQQLGKAEEAFRRALQIEPRTADAYFKLGELYWRQNKNAEAEQALRQG